MELQVKKKDKAPLLAVYLPSSGGQLCISTSPVASTHVRFCAGALSTYTGSLKGLLKAHPEATPIYKGDEVTITF